MIKTSCDACEKDLSTTKLENDYRFILTMEDIPSLYVDKDLETIFKSAAEFRVFHFCGLPCLKGWVNK